MPRNPILVVDDNPMNLKLLRILLDGEDYEVRTANTGEEALAVVETFHPRLILMDIQLPGIDGLEVTRRLKAAPETRDIVILALTAYAMPGAEESARSAGCDGYIAKPIDTRTLPATVEHYLGSKQAVKPTLQAGDYHDLLADLRASFLVEGEEEGTRMLQSLTNGFDAERAKRITHRWAGIAGTLGFPELGNTSRALEDFLESPAGYRDDTRVTIPTGERLWRLRSEFLEILKMFSDAIRGKRETPDLPLVVVERLSGKTLALVGFETAEAARISSALGKTMALTRTFDYMPSPETLQPVHGTIVNVCQKLSFDVGRANHPTLFIGSAENLLRRQPQFPQHACDFLVAPWDTDEMILRVHRLLSGYGEASSTSASASHIASPCVVIADDDPMITALVSATLGRLGAECFIAHDGRHALELTREKLPAVLILDVKMPQLDGFDVLLALKSDPRTFAVNVVMLTGCDDESEMMRGFGYGAEDYVTKPFNPPELAARVVRLLPKRDAPIYAYLPASGDR
jgi:two-component system cell cycle response regulator DivK